MHLVLRPLTPQAESSVKDAQTAHSPYTGPVGTQAGARIGVFHALDHFAPLTASKHVAAKHSHHACRLGAR